MLPVFFRISKTSPNYYRRGDRRRHNPVYLAAAPYRVSDHFSMLGLRVGRMAGTRSTHPKLQIDPAFAQPRHSSPCEAYLPPGTAYVGVASSPSVTTFIMSPYSSSSSLAALSVPQTLSEESTCWNLIPYDVPWGSDYFAYKEGSLPGPEGDCLFLRSPTPVDKKRTVRACEKCRERKAKVCA